MLLFIAKHVGMLTGITHSSPANYGIAECIERVINCHLLPWHWPLKHVCVCDKNFIYYSYDIVLGLNICHLYKTNNTVVSKGYLRINDKLRILHTSAFLLLPKRVVRAYSVSKVLERSEHHD